MNVPNPIQTENLTLILRSPDSTRAMIDGFDAEQKKALSPDWLARVAAATSSDPWVHGFELIHRATGAIVGSAGFKARPCQNGVVEIAYCVEPDHQGKGYATKAAKALTTFAFATGHVQTVRAHTLPEPNASTRVLTKSGFTNLGEATDPEDGLVWRWEKSLSAIS
jgi:RimJ/RimL family protein N-acetyltransferase